MITLSMGPTSALYPNKEYEVCDTVGKDLVAGGYAISLDPVPAPEPTEKKKVEKQTASIKVKTETATIDNA